MAEERLQMLGLTDGALASHFFDEAANLIRDVYRLALYPEVADAEVS